MEEFWNSKGDKEKFFFSVIHSCILNCKFHLYFFSIGIGHGQKQNISYSGYSSGLIYQNISLWKINYQKPVADSKIRLPVLFFLLPLPPTIFSKYFIVHFKSFTDKALLSLKFQMPGKLSICVYKLFQIHFLCSYAVLNFIG